MSEAVFVQSVGCDVTGTLADQQVDDQGTIFSVNDPASPIHGRKFRVKLEVEFLPEPEETTEADPATEEQDTPSGESDDESTADTDVE